MRSIKKASRLSLVLSVILLFVGLPSIQANADTLSKQQLSLSIDTQTTLTNVKNDMSLENKFKKNIGQIKSRDTMFEISFNGLDEILPDEEEPVTAEASLLIGGIKYKIDLSGHLQAIEASNGKKVLMGVISGYLNNIEDKENWVIMSVHYMPADNKCSISASFGVLTDDNIPASLNFGSEFIEMDEIVKKSFMLKTEDIAQADSDKEADQSLMDYGDDPPLDTDPQLQDSGSTCSNSFFTDISFQNKTQSQKLNKIFSKMSVNFVNAKNYIKTHVDTGLNSVAVICDEARNRIVTDAPAFECTQNCDPANNERTINIGIPIYIPYLDIGWQTINLSYTTSSTTLSYSPCTGAPANAKNITKWEFYNFSGLGGGPGSNVNHYLDTTETNESDASVDETGIGVRADYSYYYGVSSNKSIFIASDAYADIKYTSSNYSGTRVYTMNSVAGGYMTITP